MRCIDRAFERNEVIHKTCEWLAEQNRLLKKKIVDKDYYLQPGQVEQYTKTLIKNILSSLDTYGYFETLSDEETQTAKNIISDMSSEWIRQELYRDPFLEGRKFCDFNTALMETNKWPRNMVSLLPNKVHLAVSINWQQGGLMASTEVLGKKITKQN
ncbi:hypothetical protein BNJ_00360 [Kaumoebavirus]|uniref:hypothetical protein n=1 Tax=Kaumoebavirus TaxID=1859492 RepID=UPI0009C3476C|nr:hypothetical protein BNJ_00360 [Kaumoebavirus]ARA72180.1 hypothetical protein BNJ_00360 [Kaumoebavirus]